MFFLQTLIFFDILCFKLNRRGFTELPFSIININFKLLIICISKRFLPLEGVEQFTYIPKHYFEQEWDFYMYFGKYLKHLNHSIKSIITYNYRLGFLIQLNISEVLIFFNVVYSLNPHKNASFFTFRTTCLRYWFCSLYLMSTKAPSTDWRVFRTRKSKQGI